MRLVSFALAALALSAPGLAFANPLPAGACSVVDDGVAALPRSALIPISAPLPSGTLAPDKGAFGAAVVDVAVSVAADGRVTSARVLCARPANAAFADAAQADVAAWRFMPARDGVRVERRVAYRIVVTDANRVQRVFLGAD